MIKLCKKINTMKKELFIIAVLALLMFSCGNKQYLKPNCTLPSGVNLEEALAHSREDLDRLECEPMFDSYYERLMDVAKRDPDIENRRRFSDFLEWANQEGIIDKIQARNYYNRYFNTTFMSLQDDFNVCSSCSEDAKRDLQVELQEELGQKEDGLLRACQDKPAYYAAADQYNSILLLLDATCTACRNK
ncbi:MAG: hypothetical protein PVG44_05905 [Desulfobacterales bacterium]|jgi:hypothetical protein